MRTPRPFGDRPAATMAATLLSLALATASFGQSPGGENSVPFTVRLEEVSYSAQAQPPALQSFSSAVLRDGRWLVLGGRTVGLHTFNAVDSQAPPSKGNFPPSSANHEILVIDPERGVESRFDVRQLPDGLAGPLQATNQQTWHDPVEDLLYVIGGYGADPSDGLMVTFDTMLVFSPERVASLLGSGDSEASIARGLESEIRVLRDDRFAVTGGYLENLDGVFYLAFGQLFFGQYSTFGRPEEALQSHQQQAELLEGSDTDVHDVAELRSHFNGGVRFLQHYTEQLRAFTLAPDGSGILTFGATVTSDAAHSFHRRDGNFVTTVDPASGEPRLAAFGGVFPPGVIGAYVEPIYIEGPGIYEVSDFRQSFSQYECPVLIAYDPEAKVVYQTFFAGIADHFYHLTKPQIEAYEKVTAEGRNDGLPFINDISVLIQDAGGKHTELILPEPMPQHRLLGANAELLLAPTPPGRTGLGYAPVPEVLDLSKMKEGESRIIGHLYGGIEAAQPLPLIPNNGTSASNSVFAVTVTRSPTTAIPASESVWANPNPKFRRLRGANLTHEDP